MIYFNESTQKITTNFFDLAETEVGDAEGLYTLLRKVFIGKIIPLSNLIGFSSDTTNVTAGEKKSIFAFLQKDIDGIATIKCSCHVIHLVPSHACSKLSNSAEDLLRNLASYFHCSWKNIKKLQEFRD